MAGKTTRLQNEIASLNRTLAAKNEVIANHNREKSRLNGIISELAQDRDTKDARIKALEKELEDEKLKALAD
jgi:peptidoglycan hydrolase CwlO-like protein